MTVHQIKCMYGDMTIRDLSVEGAIEELDRHYVEAHGHEPSSKSKLKSIIDSHKNKIK
jgi:hypothetical protein